MAAGCCWHAAFRLAAVTAMYIAAEARLDPIEMVRAPKGGNLNSSAMWPPPRESFPPLNPPNMPMPVGDMPQYQQECDGQPCWPGQTETETWQTTPSPPRPHSNPSELYPGANVVPNGTMQYTPAGNDMLWMGLKVGDRVVNAATGLTQAVGAMYDNGDIRFVPAEPEEPDGPPSVIVRCQGDWSAWGKCKGGNCAGHADDSADSSAPQRVSGTQHRRYVVHRHAKNGGESCAHAEGALVTKPCPGKCVRAPPAAERARWASGKLAAVRRKQALKSSDTPINGARVAAAIPPSDTSPCSSPKDFLEPPDPFILAAPPCGSDDIKSGGTCTCPDGQRGLMVMATELNPNGCQCDDRDHSGQGGVAYPTWEKPNDYLAGYFHPMQFGSPGGPEVPPQYAKEKAIPLRNMPDLIDDATARPGQLEAQLASAAPVGAASEVQHHGVLRQTRAKLNATSKVKARRGSGSHERIRSRSGANVAQQAAVAVAIAEAAKDAGASPDAAALASAAAAAALRGGGGGDIGEGAAQAVRAVTAVATAATTTAREAHEGDHKHSLL